jgi:hypothetical protein
MGATIGKLWPGVHFLAGVSCPAARRRHDEAGVSEQLSTQQVMTDTRVHDRVTS